MRNDYEIRGETTAIIITRRNGVVYEALVDTADLPKLLTIDVKWCLFWTGKKCMAKAGVWNKNTKTIHSVLLNRVIMGSPVGKEVSYISPNGLDNRKANLRVTTHAETLQNRMSADADNLTGVRNVTFRKGWNKYVVQINGKYYGGFNTLEEAEQKAIEQRKLVFSQQNSTK